MLAYLRTYGDEVILVVNNLSPEPQQVDLDLAAFARRSRSICSPGRQLAQVTKVPYQVACWHAMVIAGCAVRLNEELACDD